MHTKERVVVKKKYKVTIKETCSEFEAENEEQALEVAVDYFSGAMAYYNNYTVKEVKE